VGRSLAFIFGPLKSSDNFDKMVLSESYVLRSSRDRNASGG
jgi:hypothetical protein